MNCPQCGSVNSVERSHCVICGYGRKTLTDIERAELRKKQALRRKRATCKHAKAKRVATGPYAGRERVECPSCQAVVTQEAG